jgi:hypothetical protein
MADETANLKDTVVTDPATPAADPKPAADPPAPRILEAVSPEAIEMGRILSESGVTKDQINELLQAPGALAAIRSAIQGNPDEFFNMLQRTDPSAEERLLNAGADRYVKRYGSEAKPSGNGKPDANSDLMREVEALREQTTKLMTEQQRRDQAAADAVNWQRYNARVDDLINLKEVKDLGLTKSELKSIRTDLNTEISKDPNALKRAMTGNFVDVPVAFKSIIDAWASDRKEAAKAAEDQRKGISSRAFPEFAPGANPFMNIEVPATVSDSWDSTEAGFAKALESAR